MQIEKCSNGYIMSYPGGKKTVGLNIESIFGIMLCYFEGKSETFYGESYGKVDVSYERPNDETED
jgi:hypothetical protein